MDIAVPKLREGTYFPGWLLERRRRAEAALTSVVATCYLLGVSTRRVDRLVWSLGVTGLSRSQVSVMARDLDELVRVFRERPLSEGPYTFVAADALTMRVREGGRVIKIAGLGRGRCQRRWVPRDPRRRHLHRGIRRRLEQLPQRPGRART